VKYPCFVPDDLSGFPTDRYYRKHSFDHYLLFSADAEKKVKQPKPSTKPIAN